MYCAYRTERRKFQRMQVTLSVVFEVKGPLEVYKAFGCREFEAETLDLSEGGVSIKCDGYLPQGTELNLKLLIFESDNTGEVKFYKPLKASGSVCSSKMIENYNYRLGICFNEIDRIDRQRLIDIVNSTLKRQAVFN